MSHINKWIIVSILAILCVIIILPPIIYDYIYPTGGDDTAHHLIVMNTITLDKPIPEKHLYDGQWIIGYPLILLREWFNIPLATSFLWFNYLALMGVVIVSYLVFSGLFNQWSGLFVSVTSFLLSSNILLFQAGAIFSLINMGILFPTILYLGITGYIKRSWGRIIACVCLLVLFGFFHASGKYLLALPIILLVWVVLRSKLDSEGKIALAILAMFIIVLFTVAYIFPSVSSDAGSQWVDGYNLVWILVACLVGLWGNKQKIEFRAIALICIVLVGSFSTLPFWFNNNSAIKPLDKEIIAYVNSLDGSEFYCNEYVAPYIYELYLNKTYKPDSGIYIYRSIPMTAGVSHDTHFNYWENEGLGFDTSEPENLSEVKEFNTEGIAAYVAENTPHFNTGD
jgi:hypothetical protein